MSTKDNNKKLYEVNLFHFFNEEARTLQKLKISINKTSCYIVHNVNSVHTKHNSYSRGTSVVFAVPVSMFSKVGGFGSEQNTTKLIFEAVGEKKIVFVILFSLAGFYWGEHF